MIAARGCWMLIALCTTDASGSLDQSVATISSAYEANRAALSSFGTIHFRTRRGGAKSVDEVLDGNWKHGLDAKRIYVFDGEAARHDERYKFEEMVSGVEKVTDRSWRSQYTSYQFLTDGHVTLSHEISARPGDAAPHHYAQIEAGTKRFFTGQFAFPLKLRSPYPDVDHLAYNLERARSREKGWVLEEVDEDAHLFGRDVVRIKFRSPREEVQFWIDLERGSVPLRIDEVSRAESFSIQVINTDLRHVGGKGWLPFHMIHRYSFGLVHDLVIDDADFDHRPDRSMFRLEFDEPVKIINIPKSMSYAPRKVCDLADLSNPSATYARRIKIALDRPAAPMMPGEVTSRFSWPIALTVTGVVLLVGVVVVRRVRRRVA